MKSGGDGEVEGRTEQQHEELKAERIIFRKDSGKMIV